MSQGASKSTAKPAGKDIRSFFGGGFSATSSSSTPKASKHFLPTPKTSQATTPQGSAKTNAIQIDKDDDKPLTTSRRISSKRKAVYVSSEEEDEEQKAMPPKKKALPTPRPSITSELKKSTKLPQKQSPVQKASSSASKPKTNGTAKASKRKTDDSDDYDDDSEDEEPVKKPPPKPKGVSSKDTRKVDDDKMDVDLKGKGKATEETKDVAKKFNWAAARAAKASGPSAPGSKPIPNGQPNCLAGLSFVFTGELSSLSRDEAVDLAKRFGGRVVGQPSSKTDYVVLGDNAGPAKIKAIEKHKLQTLDEDAFLNLIATRKGVVDEKVKAKMEKEEQKIREAAKEMAKAEKKADKEKAQHATVGKHVQDSSTQLWTTRYAPQSLREICGNKGQVEKLRDWLHDWPSSVKAGFKKPGKNGMNIYRAVLITGPPGIGKTTSAHLCAKLEGFTPIELNASDARSKKLVENSTNINNTSLDGWMGGGHATNVAGVAVTDRSCLIMDEVDGMSAGDRGGVGALNALIKKSKIPIICIANDRTAQKLKPLMSTTYNLSYRRPEAAAIRSRILTIAFKEKMKVPANVVDQLVLGTQSDIRQVLNMLSTWKLSNSAMDFDEGKELSKANEKYTIMTPFNVINKMLGPYLFSATARESLGDKMELYFHDPSFVPLFMQENYLKTEPAKLRNQSGPEKTLQHLRLMDKAASSISDSDLVDALIHGPEQHWSLMPLHAVTSCVRPASFLFGNGAGYGGPNAMSFPQWLGQNSKQGKLTRQLADIQIRMRLKVSGDKPEIRQHYVPALFPRIVKPLMDTGASAVEEVIEFMDEYYLSKEDWDSVIELGLGDNKDDIVLKKISTATKSSLTRKYNSTEHPVPFHKAQEFGKIPRKIAAEPAPDLEEAFDMDDDIEEEPDTKEEENDDITKDKLIKQAKGKGKGKATAVAKPVKKGKGAK